METRNKLVEAAREGTGIDILITNARLINVLTGMIESNVDITIVGQRVASVLPAGQYTYQARSIIDAKGKYVCPGFVDGHVHNESSMVTPAQWAKVIVPKGTTTVCTDPHEIGNVLGLPGIAYMLAASAGLPLHYFVTASSCVPAVPSVETAGATITHVEMDELLSWDRVIAVAEAMDYPGLINQGGNITPIVETGHRHNVPIEGHAPGITGRLLQAYLAAAGPRASDHESMTGEEMLQKVKAGMMVYTRGSTFLDTIHGIAEAIRKVKDTRLFGFCTDDIFAHHLLSMGHLDFGIRRLIQEGIDLVTVIQMATINVAQHYNLHSQGIGAIAPGWVADILILENPMEVKIRDVIVRGQLVVQNGEWIVDVEEPIPPLVTNTVHLPTLAEDDFVFQVPGASGTVLLNAVDMGVLLTKQVQLEADLDDQGRTCYPLPEGVVNLTIVPRHGQGTKPMVTLGTNYAMTAGAIASTVSHDSHNLAIIGKSPTDMLLAAQTLQEVGGGFVAVKDGQVLALVPLPIAGLMSPEPVLALAPKLLEFESVMPQLGLRKGFPLELIAIALPVFPEVRITDMGVVNVGTQEFIPQLVQV